MTFSSLPRCEFNPQEIDSLSSAVRVYPVCRSILFAIAIAMLSSAPTNAEIVCTVTEQGGDVVFQYSGSIDLASTLGKEADRDSSFKNARFEGGVGSYSTIHSKNANVPMDDYMLNFVSESSFSGSSLDDYGFDGGVVAGDGLLFETGLFDQIWMPNNYQSNDVISGSLTFVGASFTSLGLQPEIATWEWGNNGVTDTFVVNVGDISAVPEPSSLALFCAIGLFAFSRRRKVAIIG